MINLLARELHRSKYRLLGLVGQGQFGRVYCAIHRKTGKLVALKELGRDRFSTHKFLRELRFLLSLQHENIVTCHSIEQTRTGRYLVLDYCEAGTLRHLLEEDVQLHPIQGLTLVTQILAGLAHAHERQIVHCDIKPENILLTAHAQGWTAKISDFGIARLSQELTTDEFSNTGSPAYMAPERFYGQYSTASDLYAVGVLLFEILVGQRPFSGAPADLMSAHLNQTVEIPDSIPLELQELMRKALQKLPARRFRSAAEMLETLQRAIANTTSQLDQGWAPSTLLRFCQSTPPASFSWEFQERLEIPMQQLINSSSAPSAMWATSDLHQPPQFCRVEGKRVRFQVYPTVAARWFSPSFQLIAAAHLPSPVTNLVVQAQGCLAVTQQAVYKLPELLFQPSSTPTLTADADAFDAEASSTAVAMPQLVTKLGRGTMVAIAPTGYWMATSNPASETVASQIHLWNLRNLQPFQPVAPFHTPPCFQLLATDAHHLAVFSHQTDPASTCITGVQIDLFTRRGTNAGRLQLSLPLRHLTVTPTPYRLLAIEPNHPTSLLVLDLKPLRLRRIGLGLVPTLIAATVWGYAVMSQTGQIVLLDQYGQLIGTVDGPASPTALCFLAPHQLLIATWHEAQGYLYGVNLRELDLDLLF